MVSAEIENQEVEKITESFLRGTTEYMKEYEDKKELYKQDMFHRDLFVYPMQDFADDLQGFRDHVRKDCEEHQALDKALGVLNAIHFDLMGDHIPQTKPCGVPT